jgi:competence ComEA-like helix-hairpin-helix protein
MSAQAPQLRATIAIATVLCAIHAAGSQSPQKEAQASTLAPARVQLRLDPNRANAAELELLPRIGPKLAAAIIAYRDSVSQQPAFRTPEDLKHVPRIGPATVELLRPHLCFPDNVSSAPKLTAP